jgi:hypothetical protein
MRQSRAPTASQIENPPPQTSSTKNRLFGKSPLGKLSLNRRRRHFTAAHCSFAIMIPLFYNSWSHVSSVIHGEQHAATLELQRASLIPRLHQRWHLHMLNKSESKHTHRSRCIQGLLRRAPADVFDLLGHAFRKSAAGAFGPDLAKKLSQLVKMEKNVMRSMELVGRERMEVAVRLTVNTCSDKQVL